MAYDKKIRNMSLEQAKQEVDRVEQRLENNEDAYDDGIAAVQGHLRKLDDEDEASES